jgi:hypothetical protein
MDPERPNSEVKENPKERYWIYGILGAVFGALIVWGVIAFEQERDDEESQAKAEELSEVLAARDIQPPDEDIIVRLLGTDGGRVCELTDEELTEAVLKHDLYANGASGPGMRPAGPVDEDLFRGALAVAEVYCPDKLEDLQELADDFDFENVIND